MMNIGVAHRLNLKVFFLLTNRFGNKATSLPYLQTKIVFILYALSQFLTKLLEIVSNECPVNTSILHLKNSFAKVLKVALHTLGSISLLFNR